MAKANLQDAVHELWYWQYGTEPTNFTSILFDLIAKADLENKARLASAFPFEYQAFVMWEAHPDPIKFFAAHGIDVRSRSRGTK